MIDENAKKLLMEKNLQMKENGEIAEILKMEIRGDDIAMVLVETKNGNKVWFSYRYIGGSWMFHGFMRDDARLKKDP
ncbi:MAG: hypothetical protein JW928_00410 [Candidatus Aureabacteria bacterium]|nr:hypothetical protein [Candidatus Auribacterota bacterium]